VLHPIGGGDEASVAQGGLIEVADYLFAFLD
jgi:hypothetical protein